MAQIFPPDTNSSPVDPTPSNPVGPQTSPPVDTAISAQDNAPNVEVDEDKEWSDAIAEVVGVPDQGSDDTKADDSKQDNTSFEGKSDAVVTTPDDVKPENPSPDKQDDLAETSNTQATSPSLQDLETVAQRVMARHNQSSVDALQKEITARVMPQIAELKTSDGFVIKSAKDLEGVENPATPGKPFTPQEAEQIFSTYRKEVREAVSQAEAKGARLAAVNQSVADEALLAAAAFKEVFYKHPQLQQSVFNAYVKTLRMSQDGQYIEDAPVSLLEFYNGVLSPYLTEATTSVPVVPNKQAPTVNPQSNGQRHQDRSDIYKSNPTNLSKEDQEWADAAKEVLGV